MNVRVRVKFQKLGAMRFIGHLDTMRYFQKSLRRANIPMAYTQGFHPHPILSFAQPLGVGITSEGEYFDLTLERDMTEEDFLTKLNAQMAEGFHVSAMVSLTEKAKKGMALVRAARYRVTPVWDQTAEPPSAEALREGLRSAYEMADAINITKKTKKSVREIDLKPLIYAVSLDEETGGFTIFLAAGSENNIKPELFFTYLFDRMGVRDEYRLKIHRMDLFAAEGDDFVPLIKKV